MYAFDPMTATASSHPRCIPSVWVDDLSPLYLLYDLEISAAENVDFLAHILPRHGVFLGLTDASRVASDGNGPAPTPPSRAPGLVALHDPDDLSRTPPRSPPMTTSCSWSVTRRTPPRSRSARSGSRASSPTRRRRGDRAPRQAGDEEGTIAYDPEVEVLVLGEALPA